jgi:LPXTG-motif cell wall-anchored protein
VADPASSATLPRTGLDVWLAAVIGIALVGSGLLVRRVLPDRHH